MIYIYSLKSIFLERFYLIITISQSLLILIHFFVVQLIMLLIGAKFLLEFLFIHFLVQLWVSKADKNNKMSIVWSTAQSS